MASASSTSAKNLFVDSKRRLGERVQVNVNNMASICRQVLRGSQSADMLSKAARSMAIQVGEIILLKYILITYSYSYSYGMINCKWY